MPTDLEELNRVLDVLPTEVLGRHKERTEGTVLYRADGEPDLFLEVMESDDVGVRDETNRELLEMTAAGEGRTITVRRLDPSAGIMYVGGTQGSGIEVRHFLTWATEDGPYLFAAGADTADALNAVVDAFAKAAGSA